MPAAVDRWKSAARRFAIAGFTSVGRATTAPPSGCQDKDTAVEKPTEAAQTIKAVRLARWWPESIAVARSGALRAYQGSRKSLK